MVLGGPCHREGAPCHPLRSRSNLGLDSKELDSHLSLVSWGTGNRQGWLGPSLQGSLPLTTADGKMDRAQSRRPALSRTFKSHLILGLSGGFWCLALLSDPPTMGIPETQEPAVFTCPLPCLAPTLVILLLMSFISDCMAWGGVGGSHGDLFTAGCDSVK